MLYKDFEFRFSPEKDAWLRRERSMSFDEIIHRIRLRNIIAKGKSRNSSKYPTQEVFVVEIDDYCWTVPYIANNKEIFLKTAFPDRKINKKMIKMRETSDEKI